MRLKIGIPKSLLYYYYKDLWINFFKYLEMEIVESPNTNREMLKEGEKLVDDETCLSMKIYLGHIMYLKDKCDYILVPRLFSVCKNEEVCTNFNALYDIVNNVVEEVEILNYNVDLTTKDSELLGFLNMGKELGISYIKAYKAYKYAKEKEKDIRKSKELTQQANLEKDTIKILLAAHPYNLYDELIGKQVIQFLSKENITILYSDRIKKERIQEECMSLSTDIHWTHSKEVVASVNYYQDKVDGIILMSSFPCGPDSLSNDLISRKIKNIPILTLMFEDLNSDIGLMTRLESYIDILKQKKEEACEKNN